MHFKQILVIATLFAGAAGATVIAEHHDSNEAFGEQGSECTTLQPGPDWICVSGNWYPPGMPLPGESVASPSPQAWCSTIQPGPDWVCAGGNWYPPGMTLPAAGEVRWIPAAPAPASGCTTVRPGPDWSCANGNWYPPGMALPAGAAVAAPAPPPASIAGCTTVQPGPDWICAGGGWYPPGMPVPGGVSVAVPEPTPASFAAAPAPAPAPAPVSAAASTGTGGRLRVMTWNIHFGHGDPWGQARVIADSGADVVLLQEAQTWDEDMRWTYADRLRQFTGHNWQSAWSGGPDCNSGCQGTLILSRLPIVDSQAAVFDGAWMARARIDVGGVHVNVFNLHLEYYDTGRRSSQLLQFMDWSRQYGGPRIAGGDFNSWWDEWWIHQMETEYSDTWRDVTGGIDGGFTLNNAVRFDYLFRAHDQNWRMTPLSAWVPGTGLSDHWPVVADYSVR